MDRLVDHLFVFEGNGVITDYPGNYSQYRDWLKDKEELPVSGSLSTAPKATNQESENRKTENANNRRLSFKEKREFELLEKEIADLAGEKKLITEKLDNSATSFEELQKLSIRIGEVTQLLDEKEMRWLELSEYVS